jgi:aflatoxin B1 aldehyde reductase
MHSGVYSWPELLESLAQCETAAEFEDRSCADLAYRWVRFNSAIKPELGDCMIMDASKYESAEADSTRRRLWPTQGGDAKAQWRHMGLG